MVLAPARLEHGQSTLRRPSDRLMWLTPDRVFYVGLLGRPSTRIMGCIIAYVAAEGDIRFRVGNGGWQITKMAVVPPYVPHQVLSEARHINIIKVEAETVDMSSTPEILRGQGAVDADDFVEKVRRRSAELRERRYGDPISMDFDQLFFERPLTPRRIDSRIQEVIDSIKRNPEAPAHAEDCAKYVHLSFSRFLHLFKEEVGAPFRSFRSWKRARSLLQRVTDDPNLTHVALDSGYPDSSHFSHSIRRVYGLMPKDIFAGSRRLEVHDHGPAPASNASNRVRGGVPLRSRRVSG